MGLLFVMEPDFPVGDCDPWVQNCPVGFKCAPIVESGTSWNALSCMPVDPDPAMVGEGCVVQGAFGSGLDDCALGAICWDVDPVTLEGTCVAQCTGTPDNAWCEAGMGCVDANDGVLNLCLPQCDPLLQACPNGQGCYPYEDDFVCVPDASGASGDAGAPCQFINSCAPGLVCVEHSTLELCDVGPLGCCTPLCDAYAVEDPCPALLEECYPVPNPPPGLEHVGLCAVEP